VYYEVPVHVKALPKTPPVNLEPVSIDLLRGDEIFEKEGKKS
jgi:hypothetical protein